MKEKIELYQPNTIKELEILRENHQLKPKQLGVECMQKRRDKHAGIIGVNNILDKSYYSEYTEGISKRETSEKGIHLQID